MKTKKLINSFIYAMSGIRQAIKTQRNFRIHLIISLYISYFAIIAKVSYSNICILLICFMIILSLELINTAIEKLCDKIDTSYNLIIKSAKDTASAAVLIASVICAIIGIIIFLSSDNISNIFSLKHLILPTFLAPLSLIFIFKRS